MSPTALKTRPVAGKLFSETSSYNKINIMLKYTGYKIPPQFIKLKYILISHSKYKTIQDMHLILF